uniref:Uncharacterized protein n=1 Tax=Oryza sativa subsp. japonica TaxID=39947 RepID=Q7XI97_ORYSJ|nr:hypothetical protein [Oryza sativa Japonica Group]
MLRHRAQPACSTPHAPNGAARAQRRRTIFSGILFGNAYYYVQRTDRVQLAARASAATTHPPAVGSGCWRQKYRLGV